MFHQPRQNLGERAARFAGRDQIHIDCREDARELAQRLRETSSIHQRAVQRARHLLHFRLLQPFLENRKSFVERHSRGKQMPELLRKYEQLPVRNSQGLRGGLVRGPRGAHDRRLAADDVDLDRDAVLLFDLPDRHGAVCAIQYALNQTSLRIACAICVLWHRCANLSCHDQSSREVPTGNLSPTGEVRGFLAVPEPATAS